MRICWQNNWHIFYKVRDFLLDYLYKLRESNDWQLQYNAHSYFNYSFPFGKHEHYKKKAWPYIKIWKVNLSSLIFILQLTTFLQYVFLVALSMSAEDANCSWSDSQLNSIYIVHESSIHEILLKLMPVIFFLSDNSKNINDSSYVAAVEIYLEDAKTFETIHRPEVV